MDSDNSPAPSLIDASNSNMKLAGRYRLVSLIARGDLTDLWQAEDEVLGRTVAAKILRPELSSNAAVKRRFRVAAMAAARLGHAHVAAIFDTGEHQGSPFIVMEHLAGGTLRDQLANGPLDLGKVATWGADVAAALKHAHAAGIVHCDIRPENVLFTENGHLKVSDFAIARAAPDASRLVGSGPAGEAYMAPELAGGGQPDARADLFALGMVLYECATGSQPMMEVEDTAIDPANDETPPAPTAPRKLRAEIPLELDAVIMKALAYRPEDRISSAAALEKSLRKLEAPDPRTRPPSPVPPAAESRPRRQRDHAAVEQPPRPHHYDSPEPPGSQSFIQTEGRWLVPTVLVVLAAAALVLAIPSLRTGITNVVVRSPEENGTPVEVVRGQAYDPPPGDSEENNDEVDKAFDGDLDTSWSTTSYRTPNLGGLKKGVGLVIDLGEAKKLEGLGVQSVAGGWQGGLRFSDNGRDFSDPIRIITADKDQTFDTEGVHRYWMIWITRLVVTPGEGHGGNPYAVAITEVTPQAP